MKRSTLHAPDGVTHMWDGAPYLRTVCYQRATLNWTISIEPVTCLWCVAFGKKRTQDE